MEKFIIEGGIPLHGEVTPAGNKNAALPLLAACVMTDEPVILHNVPEIDFLMVQKRVVETRHAKRVRIDLNQSAH